MNIAIACSTNDLDQKYVQPAKKLAQLVGKGGHTIVWGASDFGLMKVLGDGVRQSGGKLLGISTELFKAHARKDVDEMIVAKNTSERKAIMLEKSDALIVTVGGLGTVDEVADMLELKKQSYHNKPVVILNSAGFYDGLKMQLERMADEGFLPTGEREGIKVRSLSQFVRFADTPEEAMAILGTTS